MFVCRLVDTKVSIFRSCDIDEVLRGMIDLYEPSMAEKGLKIQLRSAGRMCVWREVVLVNRDRKRARAS